MVHSRVSLCNMKVITTVNKFCARFWTKEHILLLLGKYSTRFLVAVVWYGVLWSLLGDEALPRQYIVSRRTPTCGSLLNDLPLDDQITLMDVVEENDYQPNESAVVVVHRNGSDSYRLLDVSFAECKHILDIKQTTILFDENFTNFTAMTENFTVDVLDFIERQSKISLLIIPDGHFFALTFLLILSSILGFVAKLFFFPPLFGMIIAGFLLRNVPHFDFANDISGVWSSVIRNIALAIVLIRGGLSMDAKQLKKLKLAVLILGIIPCVLEGAIDGIVGTFYLRMPWQWALTLGYIVAAISPAIVVPTMLSLDNRGFGKKKGITTLTVAAASLDVVISVSLFGVFLGLAFSAGNVVLDVFRAPIQILIGVAFGVLFGLGLWWLPSKHFKEGSKVRNRFFLIFGLGIFAILGSRRVMIGGSSLAGAGPLAVLILAFVSGQGWDSKEKATVSRVFLICWQFAQPLLFGLIGAEVNLEDISPSLVGQGVVLIVIGLVLRTVASFLSSLRNGFNVKEMVFISIAWIPKATVQAALGSVALDLAIERNADSEEIKLGSQVLTIAVLAIVLTAPLGAVAVTLLGPLLLEKSGDVEPDPPSDKQSPLDKELEGLSSTPQAAASASGEQSSGYGSAPLIRDLESSPTPQRRATVELTVVDISSTL